MSKLSSASFAAVFMKAVMLGSTSVYDGGKYVAVVSCPVVAVAARPQPVNTPAAARAEAAMKPRRVG